MPDDDKTDRIQGEGDYEAARRFQKAEQAFVKTGPVDEEAREAAEAPLDGPEGPALEEARKKTARGEPRGTGSAAAEARHVEDNLDHGLDETFSASDPVSISPGAD